MLYLAAALPGYFVIYNGPECGASAPDHLHFQAGSRVLFPIERDTASTPGLIVPRYARTFKVWRDESGGHRAARIDRAVDLLATATQSHREPLINIAVYYEQ